MRINSDMILFYLMEAEELYCLSKLLNLFFNITNV